MQTEHSCKFTIFSPNPSKSSDSRFQFGLPYQSEDDLLGGLRLLVEDGLGLTTVTGLLAVVTALSLSESRSLAGLVLGDLVKGVLAARAASAVGLAGLGYVDHFCDSDVGR